MYLPKSQYQLISLEELSAFNKVDFKNNIDDKGKAKRIAETLRNQNTEVILTAFGTLFSTIGANLKNGDFSKAVELKILKGFNNPTLFDEDLEDYKVSLKLPPTSADKAKGMMKRFFYKNKSTGNVKELSVVQFLDLTKSKEKYIQLTHIDWLIKGPAKDQIIDGYFLEGIETKNAKTIEALKKAMPGTELLIEGPTEYVKDTLPIGSNNPQPQDIQFDIPSPGKSVIAAKNIYKKYTSESYPEKIKENLLAESGEFLIEGTNREYVGLYHVHPTKGPMVGGRHVKAQHSKLVPRDNSKSRISTKVLNQRDNTGANQTEYRSTTNQPGASSGNYSTPSTTSTSSGGSSSGGSSSGGSSSGGSSSGGGYSGY